MLRLAMQRGVTEPPTFAVPVVGSCGKIFGDGLKPPKKIGEMMLPFHWWIKLCKNFLRTSWGDAKNLLFIILCVQTIIYIYIIFVAFCCIRVLTHEHGGQPSGWECVFLYFLTFFCTNGKLNPNQPPPKNYSAPRDLTFAYFFHDMLDNLSL